MLHESKAETLSLFSNWARTASADPAMQEQASMLKARTSAVIAVTDPRFFISVAARPGGISIRCAKSSTANAAFAIDAATLHRILSGAQNLMISLNKRSLDCAAPDAMSPELLGFIIDTQPALSRIYRAMARERNSL